MLFNVTLLSPKKYVCKLVNLCQLPYGAEKMQVTLWVNYMPNIYWLF